MTMKFVTLLALFAVFITIDGYEESRFINLCLYPGLYLPSCPPPLWLICSHSPQLPVCHLLHDPKLVESPQLEPRSRGFSKGVPYRALWTGKQKKGGRYGNNGAGTSWSPYIANSIPISLFG